MSNRELLITELENSIIAIDDINLPKDAHLRYVLNHLKYYLEKAKTGGWEDLKHVADSFGMYCTTHMDWDEYEYEYKEKGEEEQKNFTSLKEEARKSGRVRGSVRGKGGGSGSGSGNGSVRVRVRGR